MTSQDTRTELLNVAQELVQTRGYNAFSFRDLAERVRIRTASIHYHFPTKAALGRALVSRHRDLVRTALARIDEEAGDPFKQLERIVAIFRGTLDNGNRMCLCGMLAAESNTLEQAVVDELRSSFLDLEDRLQRVLGEGKRTGVMHFAGTPRNEARYLLASLEGAMLVARTFRDRERFNASARALLQKLKPSPTP